MRRSGDVRERHEQGSFFLTPSEDAPAGTRADGWATHERRARAARAAADADSDSTTPSSVALKELFKTTLLRASATQGWRANEGALSVLSFLEGHRAVPTSAVPTRVVLSDGT